MNAKSCAHSLPSPVSPAASRTRNHLLWAGLAVSALAVSAASGQLFTEGNLVVARVGEWIEPPSDHAAEFVQLVEFMPDGAPTGVSVLLPTATVGVSHACTNSVANPAEGHLSRSDDGRYLVFAGYDAGPETLHVATSSVNRVIARIDSAGAVDTTTVLSAFSGVTVNAVCSADGSAFWTVGGNSNIVYSLLGGASTIIDNGSGPARNGAINIFSGGLYTTAKSPPYFGVATVGVGLPTAAGTSAVTLLPGMPAATSGGFYFSDANTLYIADTGGLEKWTYDSGASAWALAYELDAGLSDGLRGLTGITSGGTVTLYATTDSTFSNQLVSVVDTGPASEFTVLATAPGVSFRGVAFAPVSTALTGACCIAGLCHTVSSAGCASASGVYYGNSSLCSSTVCPAAVCYANCDHSTMPPILNANDFACFLNKYAAQCPYADCDQNGTLNILDFACFLNKFATGCQ